ncbi:nucleotidyltransferase family protein [Acidithrix sp. C25]|uniref:nucleotidyltransferase family protein n=1 Tax=Acidithrix sp. C25 TaxID=1671482 RepID=UPI00191B9D1A|nr:nucleotidyltransferase family protein [Acidithrix sp. C25]CAG4924474.1 unnamed protein product [Acidithrix sp. C25]
MVMAGILLCGGSGSRYRGDTHKLEAPFRGSTVFEHSLAGLRGASIEPIAVVFGVIDLSHLLHEGEVALLNPNPNLGMASSLAIGLAWAKSLEASEVIVGLGDQPLIGSSPWLTLAHAGETSPIMVATYEGRRRNPVRISRELFDLIPSQGEVGARSLYSQFSEQLLEVECVGEPIDIDTKEELDRWNW